MLNPIAKIDETGEIIERYVYGNRNNSGRLPTIHIMKRPHNEKDVKIRYPWSL